MSVNRRLSDQFQLRLPDGMRERLKVAAEMNGRSMNAEIVAALEEKYPPLEGISSRFFDMLRLTEELKDSVDLYALDRLNQELLEVVRGVVSGKIRGVDPRTREAFTENLARWDEWRGASTVPSGTENE